MVIACGASDLEVNKIGAWEKKVEALTWCDESRNS